MLLEECGIVAQVVEPLATSQISTYYVSTFNVEYCMVSFFFFIENIIFYWINKGDKFELPKVFMGKEG